MIGKTIEALHVGETARFGKTISESDVYLYAGIISTVLGNKLPGYGTIYIRQELNFLAPVGIGDTVTAQVEVIEIMPAKNRVRLKTDCINQDGTRVIGGEAVVSPPKSSENLNLA